MIHSELGFGFCLALAPARLALATASPSASWLETTGRSLCMVVARAVAAVAIHGVRNRSKRECV